MYVWVEADTGLRTPTAHTLSYLPLTEATSITDYGTLWFTRTRAGGANGFSHSYWDAEGNSSVAVIYSGGNAYVDYPTFTISMWVYWNVNSANVNNFSINNYDSGNNANIDFMAWNSTNQIIFYWQGGQYLTVPIGTTNVWQLITITYSQANGAKIYINDTLTVTSGFYTFNLRPRNISLNSTRPSLGGTAGWPSYWGEFILEDQEWSAQNVTNWYNTSVSKFTS